MHKLNDTINYDRNNHHVKPFLLFQLIAEGAIGSTVASLKASLGSPSLLLSLSFSLS